MEESTRMVSVTQYEKKLVYLTTQHYDVTYVQVGKSFVLTLAADFDGISSRKWTSDCVIHF